VKPQNTKVRMFLLLAFALPVGGGNLGVTVGLHYNYIVIYYFCRISSLCCGSSSSPSLPVAVLAINAGGRPQPTHPSGGSTGGGHAPHFLSRGATCSFGPPTFGRWKLVSPPEQISVDFSDTIYSHYIETTKQNNCLYRHLSKYLKNLLQCFTAFISVF